MELDVTVTDIVSNSSAATELESMIDLAQIGTKNTKERPNPVQIIHSEDTGVQSASLVILCGYRLTIY